ncbi:MAG: ankyrin repeat domain-containing protein [Candidatus Korobacteraceae bacterium]
MNKTPFVVLLVAMACCNIAVGGEIQDAAKKGDLTKVTVLVTINPQLLSNKDSDGRTPLHWAAVKDHKDSVKFLLANNADTDAKDNKGATPEDLALEKGHKETVELLRTHKLSVELLEAARVGDTAQVEAVLNKGANVNEMLTYRTSVGSQEIAVAVTPLMLAAQEDQIKIVKLLLARGADVNAKSSAGPSALIQACQAGHEEVAELLIAHKVGALV